MKKFSAFLSSKSERAKHFAWDDGDVEADLTEYTHTEPRTLTAQKRPYSVYDKKSDEPGSYHDHAKPPKKFSPEHESFLKHHDKLSDVHHDHMRYYKGDSYSTNHYLRHGKKQSGSVRRTEHLHDHIKHMDEVTSHRTEHPHTVYRGGGPGHPDKFPVGHQFSDHGYTGTSFKKSVAVGTAMNIKKHKGREVVHVIHVPKGSKAHYLNVDSSAGIDGEHELLLHRGSKFKVTHHTHDEHHHYIHSRVISQRPKKIDAGEPGAAYSKLGHDLHRNDPTAKKKLKIAQSMEKAKEK